MVYFRQRSLILVACCIFLFLLFLYTTESLSVKATQSFLLVAVNEKLETPVKGEAIKCSPSDMSLEDVNRSFTCAVTLSHCESSPIKVIAYASLTKGPFLAGDPLAERIFRVCPEFLKSQYRDEQSKRIDSGG